ncbi:PTS sugar transporter subunit IIA [Aerococcus urinae]|uniref:BglG family transcription antiterminator n=1 Tax=Aerococcus TaxID=1375 RepID=UPI0018A7D6B6|nr:MULTISPECIES: PTS sugar transporter subunit IIA [Aerococcus]MCY3036270.1 PTS sugar transporter subunit IIA [Aerococcus sp. Group 2]MDK6520284.1 PTS sugar transporter subunit IIA [Aerococcus urinae]
MLSQRSLNVLKILLGNSNISIEGIQSKTELTQRQVDYDINNINDWLKNHGYRPVCKNSNNFYYIEDNKKSIIKDLENVSLNYIFNQNERKKLIFLYIFLEYEHVTLNHLISLLEVSRATIHNDLNSLSRDLINYNISLINTRDNGYQLDGNDKSISFYMMNIIVSTVYYDEEHFFFRDILNFQYKKGLDRFIERIKNAFHMHQIAVPSNNLYIISYIFYFSYIKWSRDKNYNKLKKYKLFLENSEEYGLASKLLKNEDNYQSLLLSSLIIAYTNGNIEMKTPDRKKVLSVIESIIVELKSKYAISLNEKQLRRQLYAHIRPALYRILFCYPMVNPLKEQIRDDYSELFSIIKDIIDKLRVFDNIEMIEDEISYLVIHIIPFLSFKEITTEVNPQIYAIIVCANGVGTSNLLYRELSELFPEIYFGEVVPIEFLDTVIDKADIIFSTLLLEVNKPQFLVNPIMTNVDRMTLINNVNQVLGENKNSILYTRIEEFLKATKDYIEVKDKEKFINSLLYLLLPKHRNNLKRRQPMLKEIVTESLIQVNINAENWEDAINKSASLLEKKDIISHSYTEAMIKNVKENGPYIVIGKNIALPHARPENGAKKLGISITTLKEGVNFGNKENDPVKFIFCLSAIDNASHLNALTELIELLNEPSFCNMLDNANESKEVMEYINQFNYENQ